MIQDVFCEVSFGMLSLLFLDNFVKNPQAALSSKRPTVNCYVTLLLVGKFSKVLYPEVKMFFKYGQKSGKGSDSYSHEKMACMRYGTQS